MDRSDPGITRDPRALACSTGYAAIADDGPVGRVETPLFPPDGDVPDYLVLRVGRSLVARFPVVSSALVSGIEPSRRVVYLDGARADLAALPENLPLAI